MTKNNANHVGPSTRGRRSVVVAGIVAVLIAVVGIAITSRSNESPSLPASDQQAVSAWAQGNAHMWSWMRAHWDEMAALDQHWGDASWMKTNLPDYPWMHAHWVDMSWMHDHWAGLTWMRDRGMVSISAGGMMGG